MWFQVLLEILCLYDIHLHRQQLGLLAQHLLRLNYHRQPLPDNLPATHHQDMSTSL
jgi:hypothetical protein